MAKRNFRVPIALVSLVDDHRQWFKSCYGLDVMQTPRDVAFCAHAIMPDAPEIFEVPNATLDPRFSQNPLVTGDPNIRYYAGAPLVVNISPDTGPQKMGTLCVIDTTSRPPMDAEDRETLTNLAAMVVDQLTSRLYSKRLAAINGELLQRTAEVNAINQELTSLIDTANAPIFAVDAAMRVTAWNRKISEITSIERREIEGQDICQLEGTFEEGDDESNSNRNRSHGTKFGYSSSRSGSSLSLSTMLEAPIRRVLRQALAGERCACFDFEMRSKVHARRIQLQISVEPKRDPDGRVVGVVCVGEDVAMRRRMLEATMQNHELKRTNEAKDAFLACMSHEMRTPLNGLLGMLQLAMGTSGPGEEKVRRFLKQALNSGNLLLNLINDILDITRIEAGRLELDMRAFSLRALLEETIALVRPKALDKGLDLQLDIEPALDGICQGGLVGDISRVQQVLLNLLWNALKFTPQGHVRLSARCTTCASPSGSFEKSSTSSAPLSAEDDSPASSSRAAGGEADIVHLVFEIADSGMGISPEDQAVIFERFARTHRSSAPENSGVGLGMSICKQLVELMGGRIWLHSELDKGSRVFVQLALALADAHTAISSMTSMTSVGSPTRDVLLMNDPILPESPGLSGAAQPRTADVLIVEDNDYNVDVAKQMLELLGHRVTVAFDGWEAVSLIISRDCKRAWLPTSGKPFDLVLMDCDMPVMNGFQAARALRAWERTGVLPEPPTSLARATPARPDRTAQPGPPSRPALPIIAVTAYAMSTDKDACFEAGMDDYITKPLSWSVLRDKVAVHVNSTALQTDLQLPVAATASVCGAANQLLAPAGVSREGSYVSRDTPLVALMKEHSRSMLQMPRPSSWETNSWGGGSGSFCGPASTSASVGGTLEPASAATAETTLPASNSSSGLATASTSFSISVFASASASPSPSASPQIICCAPSHDSVLALASEVPVAAEMALSISHLPEKPLSRPSSHSKLDADSEAGSIAASALASRISSGASSACGDGSCTSSAEASSSAAAPSAAVQSDAAAGRSPFSLCEIQNIFGGNDQLVRMALSRYDINAFERLRGPWEQRNFKRLGELAHQLKGTTSYICAGEAMRAAARLEQSAKALAAADTSDFLLEEVRDALRDVQRELELITPAVAAALQSLSQND